MDGGYAASLTVDNVVITDSYAEDNGGAIFHDEAGLIVYSLTITNSRISDNTAGYSGGGVFSDDARVTITGSEIDGNVAGATTAESPNFYYAGSRGGGIYVTDAYGGELVPAVHIADTTITRNHAQGFEREFYQPQYGLSPRNSKGTAAASSSTTSTATR